MNAFGKYWCKHQFEESVNTMQIVDNYILWMDKNLSVYLLHDSNNLVTCPTLYHKIMGNSLETLNFYFLTHSSYYTHCILFVCANEADAGIYG